MTDPTQPHARGRHSQADADAGAGRPAAELLAAWAGAATLQLPDDDATLRPRRRRRYVADTDARARSAGGGVDVADVEITGLAAPGIADAGLAAAGLDVSAFDLGRRTTSPAAPELRRSPGGSVPGPAAREVTVPQTAEMPAAPPAVPSLGATAHGTGPAAGRRVPAPRPAAEPTTADHVRADRFADAGTDPGWLSASSRPVPGTAGSSPVPANGPSGALAGLVTGPGDAGVRTASRDMPVEEPATVVHAALPADDLDPDEERWRMVSERHGSDEGDEGDLDPTHLDPHDDGASAAHASPETGGLDVIGGGDREHHDEYYDVDADDHDAAAPGGGTGGGRGGRRRRGPVVVGLSLVVLAALLAGIFLGGKALWERVNPVAEDYAGAGTGEVDVRVESGDSLRAIGDTLVEAGVIASVPPFTEAAEANPAATGIQPGVYRLREEMSGQAALDLLLDPASRQVTRVTLPEGLRVSQVLQRLADEGGLPLADLEAAAADPAQLGLPAYANGSLEGFLFPATYDIEPGQTAVDVLSRMVARTDQVLTDLQVPVDQRLATLTEASIVQAEAGTPEDMGKVARVIENRLMDGMRLQMDSTVNYASGETGLLTTPEDRANPSPYNTYANAGLPPGPIGNPGEAALRAVQSPTEGPWRFFVLTNPETGESAFAETAEEHQRNVLVFQQWLRDNPGN
ncbi:endolytic transglycosylase MltG [Modestobacter sp. VKM Ac-2983]|uniref:endolytic transglycosylase MltG n=1 Tax=Modestobacter sp. VKM Ac-2983 TaxID=3004137 RepID=UPI0022AB9650|nr:endolytic transglycosylase MltG [Modestobacter sp. VKM Ac-2983]MCZ2807337.1 endolytic transglycosylase MltG [Modestobacter sp. VKM Ac-2983]